MRAIREAVRWEPGLAGVGELAARKFTLDGMFGGVGKRQIIISRRHPSADWPALESAILVP